MDTTTLHGAAARPHRRGLAGITLALVAWLAPAPVPASPQGGSGHIMPLVPPGTLPRAAPVTPHLNYYGGPVISNVEVVMVLWGSGTYESFVEQTSSPSLATFYGGVTNSTHMDWLSEYDTNITAVGGGAGTNQTIGRGTYLNQYLITPSAAASGSTISDANIQAELVAQINAGHLPAPVTDGAGDPGTLYMLHFPKGKTITMGGSQSCVVFCAYHGTIATTGGDLYYGVLPDMSTGSGCDTGCGNGTAFQNQTSVASHELIEAVTDPAVGLAGSFAPPLAWYDPNNGEIGDICNGQQGTVVGGDGVTYTVQKEWSNAAAACVVTRTAVNDFSISLAPSSRLVERGSSTAYTVSTAVTGGSAQTVNFSTSGLPGGLSASFSPPSVTAGGSATLTLTASGTAALQTTTFVVAGTAISVSHTTVAGVTVLPALSIGPAAATRPPRGTQAFAASGGSGGYAWSLATNGSGGTIDAATGAYQAGPTGNVTDVVRLTDSLGGTVSADVTVTAGVSIGPATATLAPKATQTFTASGGSGTGYAWSLATNASGGTIDAAAGAYQAGSRGSVTDVIQVADSLGNTAPAAITITAAPSVCGCGTAGGPEASLLGLAGLAFARRRRRTVRASSWCSSPP
jgi:MYXO-CTERM domain-containing protein